MLIFKETSNLLGDEQSSWLYIDQMAGVPKDIRCASASVMGFTCLIFLILQLQVLVIDDFIFFVNFFLSFMTYK